MQVVEEGVSSRAAARSTATMRSRSTHECLAVEPGCNPREVSNDIAQLTCLLEHGPLAHRTVAACEDLLDLLIDKLFVAVLAQRRTNLVDEISDDLACSTRLERSRIDEIALYAEPMPASHATEYYAMDYRITDDAVHVISSGLDAEGWTRIPGDTAVMIDLATREVSRLHPVPLA